MLQGDVNFLFFIFLVLVVQEFEKVNTFSFFQSAILEKMVMELDLNHHCLKRYFHSWPYVLALSLDDCGVSLSHKLLYCVRENRERDKISKLQC